jgi:guanylate kinase
MKKKNLLVLVGPSAVGKTTVANEIVGRHREFSFIRSLTTRLPRGDGNDGEYLYTDRAGFLSEVESGGILEYTEYDGTLYGTPRSEIERIIEDGKTPLLVLDINGAISLTKSGSELSPCVIYLTENEQTLKARLQQRYLSGKAKQTSRYESRMARNAWEREHFAEFSSVFFDVINGKSTPKETADYVLFAFESFKKANIT